MSTETAIQWTDTTWNPVTGCTKVSAGCKHCYAERFAPRVFAGQTVNELDVGSGRGGYVRPRRFTDVRTHAERLDAPLRWRKPRRVFVNSMSDLFHKDVPDEFIDRVFAVMALASRHTFQVLTKRPERMCEYCDHLNIDRLARAAPTMEFFGTSGEGFLDMTVEEHLGDYLKGSPIIPNVWLGTSVEDQKTADQRIPILLETPAALRFLSCEPLLGPIEFSDVIRRSDCVAQLGKKALDGISWVIVGGESGPRARPCDVAWIRSIVRQCREAGVPAFVKQIGARPVGWGDYLPVILRDRKGGTPAEWPEDLRVREFPEPRA